VFFPTQPLLYPATFDGRIILYPSLVSLRDYVSWRQADCNCILLYLGHVNNLYNTCFWKLVDENELTPVEATLYLKGSTSDKKNECLFSQFNCNYNDILSIFRKGSFICNTEKLISDANLETINESDHPTLSQYSCINSDVIRDFFWDNNFKQFD
ncbi:hypothetical protein MXB_782, partial [Myxobolus squamalis]